jgi:hypothetical protein
MLISTIRSRQRTHHVSEIIIIKKRAEVLIIRFVLVDARMQQIYFQQKIIKDTLLFIMLSLTTPRYDFNCYFIA